MSRRRTGLKRVLVVVVIYASGVGACGATTAYIKHAEAYISQMLGAQRAIILYYYDLRHVGRYY